MKIAVLFFLICCCYETGVSQKKISQIEVFSGLHQGVGDFADVSFKNPQSYFADNGINIGGRYTFLLLSNKPEIFSKEKFNLFGAYCPGDYYFLDGYPDVDFFVEYQYAQNGLNKNIADIYSNHYEEAVNVSDLGYWKQQTLSVGGKVHYIIQLPIAVGCYGIASVGAGILEAPEYTFSIEEDARTSKYKTTASPGILISGKFGVGGELFLTSRLRLFVESQYVYSSSLSYTITVSGITDKSKIEYNTQSQMSSVLLQAGLSYRIH